MRWRNLLVVDDDPAVVELLTSVLHREDRHIVGTREARTALDEMRRTPYDLILAGLARNGSDSFDLLRRVRQLRPDTRVILTDEHSSPSRAVKAIQENAYSYFHKPLSPGAMADMVQQALDSTGWQDDIELLSARPEWLTAQLRCKLEAAERMVHFLREVTGDIAPHIREDIVAAFRELLLNAIEYGGQSDPSQRVRLSLVRTRRSFMAQLLDPGAGFAMKDVTHAAFANPDDSPTRHVEIRTQQGKRPGGFGIVMARNLVDELLYNERGNEVMFIKHLL